MKRIGLFCCPPEKVKFSVVVLKSCTVDITIVILNILAESQSKPELVSFHRFRLHNPTPSASYGFLLFRRIKIEMKKVFLLEIIQKQKIAKYSWILIYIISGQRWTASVFSYRIQPNLTLNKTTNKTTIY